MQLNETSAPPLLSIIRFVIHSLTFEYSEAIEEEGSPNGNTSNFSMTNPLTVKPVVSVEGVPCQTSQARIASQACIIGEGCSSQAR